MADRKSEPEWRETGRTVNSESGDFYANGSNRGREDDEEPVKRVTSQPSGAKRDSYFKKRDYY
jgi:hypothetical protein